jgi:large subunit ribosomal protein L31
MKKGIHPTYYPEAKVTCACGNTFTMGSTMESLTVEVCSNCHPFYTGQDKLMDKVGRVQKFRERLAQKKNPPAGGPKKVKAIKEKTSQAAQTKQQGRARVTTKKK